MKRSEACGLCHGRGRLRITADEFENQVAYDEVVEIQLCPECGGSGRDKCGRQEADQSAVANLMAGASE